MVRELAECLCCGQRRLVAVLEHHAAGGECPRCGYLGWAPAGKLDEVTRRLLREHPVGTRRRCAA